MIALDTSVAGGLVNPGTSLTWSHTCSGTNRILWVGLLDQSGGGASLITGVTYNGVAMTRVGTVLADRWTTLWVLANPATGANNVVATASSSTVIGGASVSYTGAKQTAQPDSSNTGTSATAALTVSTTVVLTNCWIVSVFRSAAHNIVNSSGFTVRQSQFTGTLVVGDSNGTVGTGSQSVSVTDDGASAFAGIIASMAPATAGVSNSAMLAVL